MLTSTRPLFPFFFMMETLQNTCTFFFFFPLVLPWFVPSSVSSVCHRSQTLNVWHPNWTRPAGSDIMIWPETNRLRGKERRGDTGGRGRVATAYPLSHDYTLRGTVQCSTRWGRPSRQCKAIQGTCSCSISTSFEQQQSLISITSSCLIKKVQSSSSSSHSTIIIIIIMTIISKSIIIIIIIITAFMARRTF